MKNKVIAPVWKHNIVFLVQWWLVKDKVVASVCKPDIVSSVWWWLVFASIGHTESNQEE